MKRRFVTGFLCAFLLGATGTAALLSLGPGCTPEIGAIDNEEQVGRQERGRDTGSYWVQETDDRGNPIDWEYFLDYQDIILSPDGMTLLAMVPVPGPDQGFDKPGMVLAARRLPKGQPVFFPSVKDIIRLNFSPDGGTAYGLSEDGLTVEEINLTTMKIVRSIALPAPFSVVDVTPDGKRLVVSNLPTSDLEELWYGGGHNECAPCVPDLLPDGASLCEFAVVDLADGESRLSEVTWRIRDIDFAPSKGEILVTFSNFIGQEPHAYIEFFRLADNTSMAKLDFANCADEVVVDPTRNLALLAPVDCVKDPISVIDIAKREFVTNLPGFGPVVVSQDRSLAVGFTVKEVLESEWDYHDQETPYGLIFVDLDTLDYSIRNYGDHAPAYTLSPDGKRMYIYENSYTWRQMEDGTWYMEYGDGGLNQLDLTDMSWKKLGGKEMRLDRFVWTDDGQRMYFLSGTQLHRLSVAAEQVSAMPLKVAPELINLRPQEDYLLLGERDSPTFYLLDLDSWNDMATLSMGYPTKTR
jgi:hypothetical protein